VLVEGRVCGVPIASARGSHLATNQTLHHATSSLIKVSETILISYHPLLIRHLSHRRTLDPLLGIFTGALAFYLHETNPRTAPPPDQRLLALVDWKREKWRRERAEREAKLGEEEIAVVTRMLKEVETKEVSKEGR
jgi:hypothetical protein